MGSAKGWGVPKVRECQMSGSAKGWGVRQWSAKGRAVRKVEECQRLGSAKDRGVRKVEECLVGEYGGPLGGCPLLAIR